MTLSNRTLLIVGDSWVAGAAGAALAARLRAAGVTVVLDGKVGRSAISLTHEFPGVLATAGAVHPDAVVILLGMNDTASGTDLRAAYQRIQHVFMAALPLAPVFALSNGAPEGTAHHDRVVAAEAAQADVFGARAIPGADLARPEDMNASDAHLTHDGAGLWAQRVAPVLDDTISRTLVAPGIGRTLLSSIPGAERMFRAIIDQKGAQ